MNYKDATFRVFINDAPLVFGELAAELDSPLITVEPGIYEIEKGGFCLRTYYAAGPSCALELGPIRLKALAKNRPGGPIGIEYIATAFGQVYRNKESSMGGKILKAREAAKTYCVPMMLGDVAGWDKVVAYVNQQWVLFLEAKAQPVVKK